MKRKLLLGFIAILVGVFGIVTVLTNENTLTTHPKGYISKNILELIITNISFMLIIIIPTYILLFSVIWKYCIKNENAKYDPNHSYGPIGLILMWGLPSIVVLVMAIKTWDATHQLNPYKPIESENKALTIEVVALNWKWLFIYPEQGIATLNYFEIPERTPIHLKLTADHSPMNSFWIPQLCGQMYCMAGMTNQEYLMADGLGQYHGRAVEINGEGYSSMNFLVKSTSASDFESWVKQVQSSAHPLSKEVYDELVKPAVNESTILFSDVEKGFFHEIVHKYMYPTGQVL